MSVPDAVVSPIARTLVKESLDAFRRRPRVWLQARVIRLGSFEEISVTAHVGNRDETAVELAAATLFVGKHTLAADDPRAFIDAKPIPPGKAGFVIFPSHRLAPVLIGRRTVRLRASVEDPTKRRFWSPAYRLDLRTGRLSVRGWRRLLPARFR